MSRPPASCRSRRAGKQIARHIKGGVRIGVRSRFGEAGEGVGGPHVGLHYVWPMSIIMKGLTSNSAEEIRSCLRMLRDTDGDKGFMHESFHRDDAAKFTRAWFAWANTLFGELMLKAVSLNI